MSKNKIICIENILDCDECKHQHHCPDLPCPCESDSADQRSVNVEAVVKLANGVTKFPKQEPRMETGNIQFGDDWVGLFLRGDDCAGYGGSLKMVLKDENINPIAKLHLEELANLLDGTMESRLSI